MTLKVYGDDQVGQSIHCPACNASVVVPAPGEAVLAPPEDDLTPADEGPEPQKSQVAGLVFGSIASLATLGAVVFLLIPALRSSREGARKAGDEISTPAPADLVLPARKPSRDGADGARIKERRGRVDPGPVANGRHGTTTTTSAADSELPEYKAEPTTKVALGSVPGPGVEDAAKPARKASPPAPAPIPAKPAKPRYSLTAQTLLNQAKGYEKSRKFDSALRAYQDIVTDFPGTQQASAAQARIKVLEKK
jgi:hypothetical protein